MQHLDTSPKTQPFLEDSGTIRAQVGSSRIIELNHMLHRLCGPPSIPLSFICERTPQVDHLTLSLGRVQFIAHIE